MKHRQSLLRDPGECVALRDIPRQALYSRELGNLDPRWNDCAGSLIKCRKHILSPLAIAVQGQVCPRPLEPTLYPLYLGSYSSPDSFEASQNFEEVPSNPSQGASSRFISLRPQTHNRCRIIGWHLLVDNCTCRTSDMRALVRRRRFS